MKEGLLVSYPQKNLASMLKIRVVQFSNFSKIFKMSFFISRPTFGLVCGGIVAKSSRSSLLPPFHPAREGPKQFQRYPRSKFKSSRKKITKKFFDYFKIYKNCPHVLLSFCAA